MIGYWIVIAMVSCAVVAVVIVSAAEASPRSSPESPSQPSQPIVIAALGASDATGEGATDPERENWVAQLADQLPADTLVHSFGVGGSWLSAAYEVQIPSASSIEPDIVVGWLIVNDLTQGESLTNYVEILDAVLTEISRPGRPVLLGNAPQLWNLPAFDGDPADMDELRREVELWNSSLDRMATKHRVTIVDLSLNPVEIADVSDDGLHPSTAGHAKLAASFRPHVLSAIDAVRIARLTPPDQ